MEFLTGVAGMSRAFRVISFISDKVKEKKLKDRLGAHGYSEDDITLVQACIEYFTSSERDRYKMYNKYYKNLYKISQEMVEKLLEVCLVGALQYEDVGEVIVGNATKALQAKEEARKLMSELSLPVGEPITMQHIVLLGYQMRKGQ